MASGDVFEHHIVHDDEVVEEGHQGGELGRSCFDKESVWLGEDVGVALDAALDAEEEVVVSFAWLELLDRVGGHAVEPADAVLAGYAEPSGAIDRRGSDSTEQCC